MTRHDLDELRELHREKQKIEERLEKLRASVQRTSPNLDGMPHGGQQKDIMAEYMANFDTALRTLSEVEKRLTERIDMIETDIRKAQLPTRQTAIIWMRYAEGKSMGQIGHELHYEKSWVYKQYKIAMESMFPNMRKKRHTKP